MNADILNVKERFLKSLEELQTPDTSWTAVDSNNQVIAAGGMIEIWDYVYEGWVMATADIHNYPIAIPKLIKKTFNNTMVQYQVQRLQTTVKADYATGHRFAKWLGLENEGLMIKYIDGQDYVRYARTY